MLTPNIIAFKPRQARGVSAPTSLHDPLGWLEISPEVYDWFIRNPDPATLVNVYGFLHAFTQRAFVCVLRQDGGFLCGMSNDIYSVDEFSELTKDEEIDFVIRKLGYEPVSV